MKQTLYILTTWVLLSSLTIKYIDPTGTYDLVNETRKEGDDIYGYIGQIQVKPLNENKIVMTFMVNKGAPSYNSGSFIDTLAYQNNMSIYTTPDLDPSCKITFQFNHQGLTVKEETEDFNSGCGFGHAVVTNGIYKKTSTKEPEIRNPMTGERIEEK